MDPFNKLSPLHLKVGRLFAKEKEKISADNRDKKGWTQRVGLANVSPKGLVSGVGSS